MRGEWAQIRMGTGMRNRDPISAGTVGEAVGGGGSMTVVGMAAIPHGAHQVSRHRADRENGQQVVILDHTGRAGVQRFGLAPQPWRAPFITIGWNWMDNWMAAWHL